MGVRDHPDRSATRPPNPVSPLPTWSVLLPDSERLVSVHQKQATVAGVGALGSWRRHLAASGGAVMRRGPFFALLLVVPLGLVLTPAVPASAKNTTLPRYSGPAPGSVACPFEAKVSFSRSLTISGGATNPSRVRGKLGSCISSDSVVSIRSGRITGSFASGFGTGCVWNGNESATLTITWRGVVNGPIGTTTYRGRASLTPSVLSYGGEQLVTNGSGDGGRLRPARQHPWLRVQRVSAGSNVDDRSATGFSSLTPSAITTALTNRDMG